MTTQSSGKWAAAVRLGFVAALPLLMAATIKGDTIELKTGERVDGTFKQATAAGAVIEVAGQPITVPLEKVRAIYFGAAPAQVGVGPTPVQEAIDALKALRSVTDSGIAYRDYSQRVLDAKVKVDRYLQSPDDDRATLRSAIRTAMLEYELAGHGWITNTVPSAFDHANLFPVMGKIIEDPEVSKCPVAQAMIALRDHPAPPSVGRNGKPIIPSVPPLDPTDSLGMTFALRGNAPISVWPCASLEVSEIEKLIAHH